MNAIFIKSRNVFYILIFGLTCSTAFALDLDNLPDTSAKIQISQVDTTCEKLNDVVDSTYLAVQTYYKKETDPRFMVYSMNSEIKRTHEKYKLKAILANSLMKQIYAQACSAK